MRCIYLLASCINKTDHERACAVKLGEAAESRVGINVFLIILCCEYYYHSLQLQQHEFKDDEVNSKKVHQMETEVSIS